MFPPPAFKGLGKTRLFRQPLTIEIADIRDRPRIDNYQPGNETLFYDHLRGRQSGHTGRRHGRRRGDIYPRHGQSVRIVDMTIGFTGIRPGEKLPEELLTPSEEATATKHRRIFTARPHPVDLAAMEAELARLSAKGLHCAVDDIFAALAAIEPVFKRYRQEQAG